MKTTATTIDGYLASLPADRRDAIARVRDAINAKIAPGYEETLQYGMISWVVPESVLPAKEVYNKQPFAFASLGSQKNYMTVHLVALYMNAKERAWFEAAYKKSGKKLDMGKGCVRFKTLDALAVDVVAESTSRVSVKSYVETYRKAKPAKPAKKMPAKKADAKKAPAKKATAKKPAKATRARR